MNKISVAAATLLLALVVSQESADASSLFSQIRRMMDVAPQLNKTDISPSPAPISETKPNKQVDLGTEKTNNSSQVDHKKPQVKVPHNETHLIGKDFVDKCQVASADACIRNQMIACIKHNTLNNGSQAMIIHIQNEGESTLNVTIIVPASVKVSTYKLEVPQHEIKKISASTNDGESRKIVLNAGYGDCVLYTGLPISEDNFLSRIPSYANGVTPMHGAYFMFLVAIIVGMTWACCKLWKREQHGNGGVAYQELEMTLPESVPAVNEDAENGWDQGWDDDWDEEMAVKSAGKGVGSLSANGLTSRSPNREGWENDWDD